MKPNLTRQQLAAGEVVIGSQIQQFASPEVARVLAAAGFDFAWIDAEHGPFDHESVHALARAGRDAGLTPLVRVGEFSYALVARALDAGAQGVILPRAGDVDELRTALAWTRFPPDGTRGYGLSGPHLSYRVASVGEIIAHHNTNTLAVVQFETREAIERCDTLLALPFIDVALVGPGDLSIALGVPGELEHPRLIEAVSSLVAVCRRRGVAPGIHLRDHSAAERWIGRGMRFLSVGSEHTLLLEKAREVLAATREQARRARATTGP